MRVDICASDDDDTKAALLAALATVGARSDDRDSHAPDESPLGAGLHRFRTPAGDRLTVYADAWSVDLEGPDAVVNRVLAAMAGGDY